MFKKLIQKILEKYVIKYFKTHPEVRLVVVVGSVGKTGTKTILSQILDKSLRVRMHPGNHNTDISAPLAILGVEYPSSIRSVSEWRRVIRDIKARINSPADVDIIIQELGVDSPGDMQHFVKYLRPDVAVVTAVTPEHMVSFSDLADVAREELQISKSSKATLVNADDTPREYFEFISSETELVTYGVQAESDFKFNIESHTPEGGFVGSFQSRVGVEQDSVRASVSVVGQHSLLPVVGAVAASSILGVSLKQSVESAVASPAVPGRMNLLRGVKQSTIIDDTYNSSPAALKGALSALFSSPGRSQRIAIIGSMNELGGMSQSEHEAIGRLCTPDVLDILITVGEEASKYIATTAKEQGCVVYQTMDSREAGRIAIDLVNPNAIILAKGSEGGIFIEEAVKHLLEDEGDVEKLVRQSEVWLKRKQDFFQSN